METPDEIVLQSELAFCIFLLGFTGVYMVLL